MRFKESDGTIHFDSLSVYLSICPSDCLLVCPSPIVCLAVCPSVYPSFCLSVSLAVRFLSAFSHWSEQHWVITGPEQEWAICPFSSWSDHQSDLRSICPTVCLPGLQRGLLLTVTGHCSSLVYITTDSVIYFLLTVILCVR